MKCTNVCAAQTTYLFLTKLSIEPDFHCLADENAKPRPEMNIKVATFTESKKCYYMPYLHIFVKETVTLLCAMTDKWV